MNFSLADLGPARATGENEEVYVYVMKSAKWNGDTVRHYGSGPNFQGERITLCTCKHSMRAGRHAKNWLGTWVAGFTSSMGGIQTLVYLMRVEYAFNSHFEIWQHLPPASRQAKSMRRNRLGDICEPRGPIMAADYFNQSKYFEPCKGHSHFEAGTWTKSSALKDLDYRPHDWANRSAPLLLGEAKFSFLWSHPRFASSRKLTQGCAKINSVSEFLDSLRPLP